MLLLELHCECNRLTKACCTRKKQKGRTLVAILVVHETIHVCLGVLRLELACVRLSEAMGKEGLRHPPRFLSVRTT